MATRKAAKKTASPAVHGADPVAADIPGDSRRRGA